MTTASQFAGPRCQTNGTSSTGQRLTTDHTDCTSLVVGIGTSTSSTHDLNCTTVAPVQIILTGAGTCRNVDTASGTGGRRRQTRRDLNVATW